MCTVSWIREDDGYQLFFNRDERKIRGPARPPSTRESDRIKQVFPVDPDGGGSWIGTNEMGVSLCILNHYPEHWADPTGPPVSRGLLLVSLLGSRSVSEAVSRAGREPLRRYLPFVLVGIAADESPVSLTWNGRRTRHRILDGLPLLTTSSFSSSDVVDSRRGHFRRFVTGDGPVSADKLLAFHRGHYPQAGSKSVCMHREDAATVSLSHIRVGPRVIRFAYADGPPCMTEPGAPVELARRGLGAEAPGHG